MTFKRLASRIVLGAVLIWPLSLANSANSQENSVFLWELESSNNTVSLLGSIHLLRETDYPLPEPIQTAFDAAETVVFEVDIAELNSPDTLETILQAALPDSPEETLLNALSPDTYRLAEAAVASVGLPLESLNQFEPWFLFINLPALKLLQLGFDPAFGIDAYLSGEANRAGKAIAALETVEQQLGFLDDLPVTIQSALVEQTILELDILESSFTALLDAWQSGDVGAFEQLVLAGFADYPEVYDVLLAQRNETWLTTIETFIDQPDDYLVVVGAAHLVGEDGLVAQLQERGYVLRQVGNDD